MRSVQACVTDASRRLRLVELVLLLVVLGKCRVVQEWLSRWEALSRRCGIRVSTVHCRSLMARDHVILRSFFDFRTVDFGCGLLCFEIEILNRLSVALNASMVSNHGGFAWRCV